MGAFVRVWLECCMQIDVEENMYRFDGSSQGNTRHLCSNLLHGCTHLLLRLDIFSDAPERWRKGEHMSSGEPCVCVRERERERERESACAHEYVSVHAYYRGMIRCKIRNALFLSCITLYAM